MAIDHHYVVQDGKESLTVILDYVPQVISTEHINYERIKKYLLIDKGGDTQEIRDLIAARTYATNKLARLSERVAVVDDQITFDGDVIDNALSKQILRIYKAGEDFEPIVAFMENIALNPSRLSRVHLYNWLNAENFTITSDGMIVGYKGVQRNRNSVSSGVETVYVNDEPHMGYIPNPDGAEIYMARTDVDTDRDRECSNGLHIGTWSYASTFASVTLKVLVNPRDVVSVPRDAQDQKMRACRYIVVGEVTEPNGDPVERTEPAEPVNVFSEDSTEDDINIAFDEADDEELEDWEREGFASEEDYYEYYDDYGADYEPGDDDLNLLSDEDEEEEEENPVLPDPTPEETVVEEKPPEEKIEVDPEDEREPDPWWKKYF